MPVIGFILRRQRPRLAIARICASRFVRRPTATASIATAEISSGVYRYTQTVSRTPDTVRVEVQLEAVGEVSGRDPGIKADAGRFTVTDEDELEEPKTRLPTRPSLKLDFRGGRSRSVVACLCPD